MYGQYPHCSPNFALLFPPVRALVPMASFHDLTTAQLKQAVSIREQIESLQEKLDTLLGGTAPTTSGPTKGKRVMSAATKRKMAAAQQARWGNGEITCGRTGEERCKKESTRESSTEEKGVLS